MSWLLENYKERNLNEFEILHIISDGRYAQGVLLEGQSISTNPKTYRETVEVFKRVSRKWKIRWSWVKEHTGNLGNQIADSLAKKGAEKSSKLTLEHDARPEICNWISKIRNATIKQSQADKLFWINQFEESKDKQQRKHISPSFCKCTSSVLNDFNRNSKLSPDQQLFLVNKIQVGTHLEVFIPDGNNTGWHGGKVKSLEWLHYQPYFNVEWDNVHHNTMTKLHLEHYRLRRLKNLSKTSIDRSDYLLRAVSFIEGKTKMDIDENRGEAMDIDKESWKSILSGKNQKTKRKPPLRNIVKPRNNGGDLRRKWCPVKTCKHHGGKGLICRKTHLKTHGDHFQRDSPFFKAIKAVLEEDQTGWTPCVGCKKLVGFTNDRELCLIC